MKHLILIRHGQSEWNQQKRFTGWVDVGLTDKGRAEAKKAGELIKEKKIKLDSFYTMILVINLKSQEICFKYPQITFTLFL